MPNLWLIFTTGLLTGGLTCLAVQGGLLVAADIKKRGVIVFLISKLIAYTVLGFLLGSLGLVFQLSIATRAGLQILVVVFMVGSALNILEVHPIFRYFVFQPPRFLTRYLRSQSSPVVLGVFTLFIPCGTTQAMMALAIGSGSSLVGALIMFAFILGTSPAFFVLMNVFNRIGKLAALILLVLALYNLDGALALTGSNYTFGNIWKNIYCTISFCSSTKPSSATAVTAATVYVDENGYTTDQSVLKAGENIKLTIINRGGQSCIQAFTIPSLGIQKVVRPGTTEILSFVAPSNPGQLNFMCSMGMYRGSFEIK